MLVTMTPTSRIEGRILRATERLADWVDPADDWQDPSVLRVMVCSAGLKLSKLFSPRH